MCKTKSGGIIKQLGEIEQGIKKWDFHHSRDLLAAIFPSPTEAWNVNLSGTKPKLGLSHLRLVGSVQLVSVLEARFPRISQDGLWGQLGSHRRPGNRPDDEVRSISSAQTLSLRLWGCVILTLPC
ncbi:hypothetical protein Pcinc_010459 [Petrolisthes cinctipes]|uniref:Uncharacterized protein n=1 Tax=Petrolisthes cinctipes TaxID=88211 RepID=A0AAE1G5B9_PETCI|nr:hypothetical protein Pcinc_010459 [Petrolisthes cinctipes]